MQSVVMEALVWIVYLIALYYSIFWLLVVMERGFEEKRGKLRKNPFVSVIIPAYNEEKHIKGTIDSALAIDYPKDKLEIIVVNHGSTDGTRKLIESYGSKVRALHISRSANEKKGTALNAGLKIAKGEFFACLDADSFVHKDTLKKMLAIFQDNGSELAIVTPSMRVLNPKTLIQKFQRLEYIMSMTLARFMAKLDCAYVAPGPFSLYRTEYVRKLGGFDETNITEDQEIGYRMQKHHYKIVQCHDGEVYTIAPNTMKAFYKQRNRWFKGGLTNVLKYRNLMFNKAYAHFGFLQMPINIFAFFTGAAASLLFFYVTIWPIMHQLYNLYLINFNIWPFLNNLEFSLDLLNIEFAKFFVILASFALIFLWFYISHKSMGEKMTKHGILHIVPFFLVYYLMLSVISVIVVAETLVGKSQKW